MADIKDLGQIVDKWRRRAATASVDYQQGIQRPRVSWQQATLAAVDIWQQAISQAAARGAFGRGVQNSSDAIWQQGALRKGVSRWAPGVQASQDKYARNFAPYAEVIRNLQLPPRGPTGDPGNLQRVAAVTQALRQKKESLQGGG